MTVGTEQLVTVELFRDFVEGLKVRADLDARPLTKRLAQLPELGRYVGLAGDGDLVGDQVARGLRALWRQRFMPHVLSAERLVKWNTFFILEVMYFYPHARGLPFPDTLKDAAVLLCDADHLALIVADGDAEQAARLIADNPGFWARLIPASMTPAEQTLHSRRNASLAKLAAELNRQIQMVPLGASQQGGQPQQPAREPKTNDETILVGENEESVAFTSRIVLEPSENRLPPLSAETLSPGARRILEAFQHASGHSARE